MEDQIREKFYKKIMEEYSSYKEYLRKLTPEEIITHSYETVIKEEMTFLFHPTDKTFDEDELEVLFKEESILDMLYDEWISSSYINQSIQEDLRECVEDSITHFLEDDNRDFNEPTNSISR